MNISSGAAVTFLVNQEGNHCWWDSWNKRPANCKFVCFELGKVVIVSDSSNGLLDP